MSNKQHSLCLALIVMLSFPGWSGGYNDNNYGTNPLKIMCLIGAFLPSVSAINVTDEWSYQTTNAQSVIGTIGFLTMSFNFLSAAYFYWKVQEDVANVLQERLNELENNHNYCQQEDDHFDNCALQIDQYITKKQLSRVRITISNSDSSSSSDHGENQ